MKEKKAVEVGNIFKLGTKYSAPFDLKFRDKDSTEKPVLMGCYGIGLGRLLGTVVEASHDDRGIIWPASIAPFAVHLIQLGRNSKITKFAEKIYKDLQEQGIEVLYDDRENKTPGEKFAESDLIGIPVRLVVSERTMKENSVELKERSKTQIKLVKISQLVKTLHVE